MISLTFQRRIDLSQSSAPALAGDESTVPQGDEKRDRARASLTSTTGAAAHALGQALIEFLPWQFPRLASSAAFCTGVRRVWIALALRDPSAGSAPYWRMKRLGHHSVGWQTKVSKTAHPPRFIFWEGTACVRGCNRAETSERSFYVAYLTVLGIATLRLFPSGPILRF
jgi:hypothetical protein